MLFLIMVALWQMVVGDVMVMGKVVVGKMVVMFRKVVVAVVDEDCDHSEGIRCSWKGGGCGELVNI